MAVGDGPTTSTRFKNTFDDVASGRENNFNLLRFLAACAVLVSHSVALSTGNPAIEPLWGLIGLSIGDISVDVFFITSGFLVSASLLARRSVTGFVTARALRIYPALVVAVTLTFVAVGFWFTSAPLRSFVAEPESWRFLFKNSILFRGVAYTLPGAFQHNPIPLAVNGSLWSLPVELAMYGLLIAIWVALIALRLKPERFFPIAISAICALGLFFDSTGLQVPRVERQTWHLIAMFFAGATLQMWRSRVPFDLRIFFVLLIFLIGSAYLSVSFSIIYTLTLPYLVLYLAYAPISPLRQFNRLGDYSYGLYIYAFPVQQMLASAIPGIQPLGLLTASLGITLILAVASWHLIEKRALRLKSRSRSVG